MAADAKVEIAVELKGADDVARKLVDIAWQAQDAVNNLSSTITQNTQAEDANTSAVNTNASAIESDTNATNNNTSATNTNTEAQDRNAEAAKAAGVAHKQFADDVSKAMAGLTKANNAFVMLMQGNVIGAIKMASSAAKDFFAAIVTNPAIAAITAIIGAVAAVRSAWIDAQEAAKEYADRVERLGGIKARREKRLNGDKDPFAEMTDEDLEKAAKAAKSELGDADYSAEVASDIAQGYAEKAKDQDWLSKQGEKALKLIANLVGADNIETTSDTADRAIEQASAKEDAAQAAQDKLDAINAEIERRKNAKQEADTKTKEQNAENDAAREAYERGEKYDKIERDVNDTGGNGKLAALEARKEDLEADKDGAKTYKEKLSILEKIKTLEGQISAEKQKDADKEAERNKRQEEWLRKKRLEKMDAQDQLKYINAEIAELRKGERNEETEQKMRQLIDERDRVQEGIDRDAKTAAEKQKKEQDELAEKQKKFLHRNDTSAKRMAQIRKEIGEAKESGDTGRMLDLMMQGEELADEFDQTEESGKPLRKSQIRKQEREARKEREATQKEATRLRRQITSIERGIKRGDASAIEQAAKMTSDTNGVPSATQLKDGKIVKVEGQDRTNQLLEKVVGALS